MIGLRETPGAQTPERSKADKGTGGGRALPTFRDERAAILLLYAARIASAELFSKKDEVVAIIAAIRSEQRAALKELESREQTERSRKNSGRSGLVAQAARQVTRRRPHLKHHRPHGRYQVKRTEKPTR